MFKKNLIFVILGLLAFQMADAQDSLKVTGKKNLLGGYAGIGFSPEPLFHTGQYDQIRLLPSFEAGLGYQRRLKRSFAIGITTGITNLRFNYSDSYYIPNDTITYVLADKNKYNTTYLMSELSLKKNFGFQKKRDNNLFAGGGVVIWWMYFEKGIHNRLTESYSTKSNSFEKLEEERTDKNFSYNSVHLHLSPFAEVGFAQKIRSVKLCVSYRMIPFYYSYPIFDPVPTNQGILQNIRCAVYY